jgi:hypothetical protein
VLQTARVGPDRRGSKILDDRGLFTVSESGMCSAFERLISFEIATSVPSQAEVEFHKALGMTSCRCSRPSSTAVGIGQRCAELGTDDIESSGSALRSAITAPPASQRRAWRPSSGRCRSAVRRVRPTIHTGTRLSTTEAHSLTRGRLGATLLPECRYCSNPRPMTQCCAERAQGHGKVLN